jgi:hypothetical protein
MATDEADALLLGALAEEGDRVVDREGPGEVSSGASWSSRDSMRERSSRSSMSRWRRSALRSMIVDEAHGGLRVRSMTSRRSPRPRGRR